MASLNDLFPRRRGARGERQAAAEAYGVPVEEVPKTGTGWLNLLRITRPIARARQRRFGNWLGMQERAAEQERWDEGAEGRATDLALNKKRLKYARSPEELAELSLREDAVKDALGYEQIGTGDIGGIIRGEEDIVLNEPPSQTSIGQFAGLPEEEREVWRASRYGDSPAFGVEGETYADQAARDLEERTAAQEAMNELALGQAEAESRIIEDRQKRVASHAAALRKQGTGKVTLNDIRLSMYAEALREEEMKTDGPIPLERKRELLQQVERETRDMSFMEELLRGINSQSGGSSARSVVD